MRDEPREAVVRDGSVWPGEKPQEGGHMKVRLLQASVIQGSVWPVGEIVDVPERQAQELIGLGRAEAARDVASKPASALPTVSAEPAVSEPGAEDEAADRKGKRK